jgi:hypothetical protein
MQKINICKIAIIIACAIYSPIELSRIIISTVLNPHIMWSTPLSVAIPELVAMWGLMIFMVVLVIKHIK